MDGPGPAEELRRFLSEQRPDSLRPDHVALVNPGRPLLDGGVPAVGMRMVIRESGLIVPAASEDTLDRLVRLFVTPEELLDEHITLEQVIVRLRRHRPEDVLEYCSQLLFRLASDDDPEAVHHEVADRVLTDVARQRAHALVRTGRLLVSPQAVLVAAKLALLSDEADLVDRSKLEPDVFAAILGIAGALGSDLGDSDEEWGGIPRRAVVEMLQNQIFNASENEGALIGRSYELKQYAQEIDASLFAEYETCFAEVTGGARWDDLWAVGLVLWISTVRKGTIAAYESVFGDILDRPEARAALDFFAPSLDVIRGELRTEQDRLGTPQGWEWGFNTFRRYPAFTHPDDGRIIVLHPEFLLSWCTWEGFYVTVRTELFRRANEGSQDAKVLAGRLGDHLGRAYERVASASLEAQVLSDDDETRRLWTEEDLAELLPDDTKVCDLVVRFPTCIVMLEIVSKRLTEKVAGGGDPDALDTDLAQAVDKKLVQLAETAEAVTSAEDPLGIGPSLPVYPVIISTSGIPWNPILARAVHERASVEDRLAGPRFRPLRIVGLTEVAQCENLAERGGRTFGDVLELAHARGKTDIALDQVLWQEGLELHRPDRLAALMAAALEALAAYIGEDPEDDDRGDGPEIADSVQDA